MKLWVNHRKSNYTSPHYKPPCKRSANKQSNDEESGGSSKLSKTSEDGDYSIPSIRASSNSECLNTSLPMGRDMAKKGAK